MFRRRSCAILIKCVYANVMGAEDSESESGRVIS
jgi:hypothetical protein